MSGGGRFHVAKLLQVYTAADGVIGPVEYEIFTNEARDGSDGNWSEIIN